MTCKNNFTRTMFKISLSPFTINKLIWSECPQTLHIQVFAGCYYVQKTLVPCEAKQVILHK